MKIESIKADMAEMFGISVKELGDPFSDYRDVPLPEPIKYKCTIHGWWFPSDNICCPGCKLGLGLINDRYRRESIDVVVKEVKK